MEGGVERERKRKREKEKEEREGQRPCSYSATYTNTCRQVFCNSCSDRMAHTPFSPSPVRVCLTCYEDLPKV